MRTCGATFLVAAALALGLGCGPQEVSEADPPSSGGLGPNGVGPPPPSSTGLCHDVTGSGVGWITDQRSMAVPPLTGGAMADGRYVLTRYEWYTPNQLHT